MLLSLVLFFFFFKQKTAYEMRISDWSSDVCPSDLIKASFPRDYALARIAESQAETGEGAAVMTALRIANAAVRARTLWTIAAVQRQNGDEPDRKSAVKGKSVSVRLGLGGRRIITKKKH